MRAAAAAGHLATSRGWQTGVTTSAGALTLSAILRMRSVRRWRPPLPPQLSLGRRSPLRIRNLRGDIVISYSFGTVRWCFHRPVPPWRMPERAPEELQQCGVLEAALCYRSSKHRGLPAPHCIAKCTINRHQQCMVRCYFVLVTLAVVAWHLTRRFEILGIAVHTVFYFWATAGQSRPNEL